MEKIIFFGLVIPILGFVLYLGATAIMKGFSAKSANKANESSENEKIDVSSDEGNKLSDEIERLNQLLNDDDLTNDGPARDEFYQRIGMDGEFFRRRGD